MRRLEDELDREAMEHSLVADSTMALTHKNQPGLYEAIYDKVVNIRLLAEFDKQQTKIEEAPITKEDKDSEKVVADLDIVKAYKVLQETGILDHLEKLVPPVPK